MRSCSIFLLALSFVASCWPAATTRTIPRTVPLWSDLANEDIRSFWQAIYVMEQGAEGMVYAVPTASLPSYHTNASLAIGDASGTGKWVRPIMPTLYGGTGATNAADARVNLLPSLTGNAGEVLTVSVGEADVEWSASAGGDTYHTTYAGLSTLDFTAAPDVVYVTDSGKEGAFVQVATVSLPAWCADADVTGYAVSEPGATGKWVHPANGELNVLRFGAVADATTDATAAIQEAVDLMLKHCRVGDDDGEPDYSTGDVNTNRLSSIYIPAGTYSIEGTINVAADTSYWTNLLSDVSLTNRYNNFYRQFGFTIRGDGYYSTMLYAPDSTDDGSPVVLIHALRNWTFRDIGITYEAAGDYQGHTAWERDGLYLLGCSNHTVKNLWLWGLSRGLVLDNHVNNWAHYENITARNCALPVHGIHAQTSYITGRSEACGSTMIWTGGDTVMKWDMQAIPTTASVPSFIFQDVSDMVLLPAHAEATGNEPMMSFGVGQTYTWTLDGDDLTCDGTTATLRLDSLGYYHAMHDGNDITIAGATPSEYNVSNVEISYPNYDATGLGSGYTNYLTFPLVSTNAVASGTITVTQKGSDNGVRNVQIVALSTTGEIELDYASWVRGTIFANDTGTYGASTYNYGRVTQTANTKDNQLQVVSETNEICPIDDGVPVNRGANLVVDPFVTTDLFTADTGKYDPSTYKLSHSYDATVFRGRGRSLKITPADECVSTNAYLQLSMPLGDVGLLDGTTATVGCWVYIPDSGQWAELDNDSIVNSFSSTPYYHIWGYATSGATDATQRITQNLGRVWKVGKWNWVGSTFAIGSGYDDEWGFRFQLNPLSRVAVTQIDVAGGTATVTASDHPFELLDGVASAIYIAGMTDATGLNGLQTITYVDDNEFTFATAVGNGTYTGTSPTATGKASDGSHIIYVSELFYGTGDLEAVRRGDWMAYTPGSGADDLGNHTATEDIVLGDRTYAISGDGGHEGLFVAASGNVHVWPVVDLIMTNNAAIGFYPAGLSTSYDAMTLTTGDDLKIGSSNFDDLELIVGGVNPAVKIKETTGFIGIGDGGPDAYLEISVNGGSNNPFFISSDDNNDGDIFKIEDTGEVTIGRGDLILSTNNIVRTPVALAAGTGTIDFTAGELQTVSMGGDLTLTNASNIASGRSVSLRVLNNQATDQTLYLDTRWRRGGEAHPITVPTNDVVRVTLQAFGTTAADVDCAAVLLSND